MARREPGLIVRTLQRVLDLRDEEVYPLVWACAYFFCILAGYYVLRPIRDEMGLAGGVQNLPWLFSGTLGTMLLVHPPFAALVARLPRLKFVQLSYRFFILNLVVFYLLLRQATPEMSIWIGRVFYVWASVFNLFVISVFWAFMTDSFAPSQAKRLFGLVAFGGTFGAMVGSAVTAGLAATVGPINLLLVTVVLLELAVISMKKHSSALSESVADLAKPGPLKSEMAGAKLEKPPGGLFWSGILNTARSPYLLGISGYILLFTITATFLYFQQAEIIRDYTADRAIRTTLFARIDFAVNSVSILTQLFLTGRIIALIGLPLTLTLLPGLCVVGFATLGLRPTIGVLILFQVLRRAGDYAIARPAREVLFTVLSREDKYKAKNFIDTFVYRSGDQIGAWSYSLFGFLGFGLAAVSFIAVPLAGFWLVLGFVLGRDLLLREARDSP